MLQMKENINVQVVKYYSSHQYMKCHMYVSKILKNVPKMLHLVQKNVTFAKKFTNHINHLENINLRCILKASNHIRDELSLRFGTFHEESCNHFRNI